MKESKQRLGGVAINWITIFLQVIISLFFIPFFLKTVGDKQYGLYSFSTSLIAWADVLMVSIASAYFKFLTREKKNHGDYGEARACGIFFKIFLVIALAVLIVGLLFDTLIYSSVIRLNEYTSSEKNQICLLVLFSLCSTTISTIFTTSKSYPYYKQKYVFVYSLALVQLLVQTGLSILFLKLGYGVIFVAISHFGTSILSTLILSFFSHKSLNLDISAKSISEEDKKYRKALGKEILIFSSFVIINTVVDMLNKNLDKILLGFYNADAVSTYQLAYTIPSYLVSITSIISIVNVQRINDAYFNGNGVEDLNNVFLRVSRIQTIVTFLLVGGFIVVGKEFVGLWLGDGRINVYYVASILLLTYSLTCCNALSVIARRIQNSHIKAAFIYLGIAVFNILLSVVLISVFQKENAIWACVIGTVVTYVLGHYVLMQIYDNKYTHLKIFQFFKDFLIHFSVAGSLAAAVYFGFSLIPFNNEIVALLVKGFTFVMLYLGFLLLYERNIILPPFLRIINKLKLKFRKK